MNALFKYGTGLMRCGACDMTIPEYEARKFEGEIYCGPCATHFEAEAFAQAIDGLFTAFETVSATFASLVQARDDEPFS